MAGIDHTIIGFHNGKLMRSLYQEKGDDYVSLLPFKYNRDGEILDVEFDKEHELYDTYSDNQIIDYLIHSLGDKIPRRKYCYKISKDLNIVYIKDFNCNIVFYLTKQESFVTIGGYGHYGCPYLHFYNRGYGIGFERKMAKECYRWLCEDLLEDTLREYCFSIYQGIDAYQKATDMYEDFKKKLNFISYWDMSEEQQVEFENNDMIELD